MTRYKSHGQGRTYSKLRRKRIQKGDGWTPAPFCGTGLSYTVSDSAGCGVLGRRMVDSDTMNTAKNTTTRIILLAQSIIRSEANAENAPYALPYTLYTYSMIPHTKYDLSYCTVSGTVRGSEVAA